MKSHGTRQLQKYVRELAGSEINPAPTIRTLKETPSSVRLDGDGGPGYLVAARGVEAACAKAREVGLALCSTTNHGHVGSAGIYARLALEHGLISWCLAGGSDAGIMAEQYRARILAKPDHSVWDAMAMPPMLKST